MAAVTWHDITSHDERRAMSPFAKLLWSSLLCQIMITTIFVLCLSVMAARLFPAVTTNVSSRAAGYVKPSVWAEREHEQGGAQLSTKFRRSWAECGLVAAAARRAGVREIGWNGGSIGEDYIPLTRAACVRVHATVVVPLPAGDVKLRTNEIHRLISKQESQLLRCVNLSIFNACWPIRRHYYTYDWAE